MNLGPSAIRAVDLALPFYVYRWVDPRNNRPFYVGKGALTSGRYYSRAHDLKKHLPGNELLRKVCHKISAAGLKRVVEIVGNYATEAEAHAEEIRLILVYGRRQSALKTGTLCNLTDGGEGVSRDCILRA